MIAETVAEIRAALAEASASRESSGPDRDQVGEIWLRAEVVERLRGLADWLDGDGWLEDSLDISG